MTIRQKKLINNFLRLLCTSGAFILGVPAGSPNAILCHISDVMNELSPSTQSRFMSPSTQFILLPSGQMHIKGLLHKQFCCTKILEAKDYNLFQLMNIT